LSKEFDVLAIAVSGETESELRMSSYLHLKGMPSPVDYTVANTLLSFGDYYSGFLKSGVKFKQDYEKLLDYTRTLNEDLHKHKIEEKLRSLLISGILIALQNRAFKDSYKKHKTPIQIGKSLLETIVNEFADAKIPDEKAGRLRQAFSFITTDQTLTTEKEFFVALIDGIDANINSFVKTHKFYDIAGQFYVEFLKYANNEKGLGIVLTPPHIADLFVALAGVNKNSVVFDNCCGTAGLLIASMKAMVSDAKSNQKKIASIQNKQLVGIESLTSIYTLAVSNMVVHGDGKTNIVQDDCFKRSREIKKKFHPTVGLLNPPYDSSKNSKGDELKFVLNNLETLEQDGKCVAIVPIGCAIAFRGVGAERKRAILEKHTLEAVMSMPEELFHNSKVNVATVIMVFTAHRPHPAGQKTWFGYWRDDGLVLHKVRGRIDANETWDEIKKQWVNAYRNKEVVNDLSLMTEVTATDEWCVEAYLKPDYNKITEKLFNETGQRYLAFRFLNNLLDFSVNKEKRPPVDKKIKLVPLNQLFKLKSGLAKSKVKVVDDEVDEFHQRYIRPSKTYEGSIDGFVDSRTVEPKYIFQPETIYVSTDGQGSHTYSYVSSFRFIPNSNVSVLIPKRMMSVQEKIYYSMCITLNRYRYSYGRKPKGKRLENCLIPEFPSALAYKNIFQEILNRWKSVLGKNKTQLRK
jgi:type I restriction-modification system DNA methylase subunit